MATRPMSALPACQSTPSVAASRRSNSTSRGTFAGNRASPRAFVPTIPSAAMPFTPSKHEQQRLLRSSARSSFAQNLIRTQTTLLRDNGAADWPMSGTINEAAGALDAKHRERDRAAQLEMVGTPATGVPTWYRDSCAQRDWNSSVHTNDTRWREKYVGSMTRRASR